MKKTHLLAATALVATMMLNAPAFAADASTTTKPAATAPKAVKPAQGPMHEAMMEMKAENKEEMAELKTKHEELHKIATAATFDKSAYLAKHEEIAALHAKMAKARAEIMADKLANMTAEQRAKLPDMSQRPMMQHHMMGKGMGGGMMGNGPAAAPKGEAPAEE